MSGVALEAGWRLARCAPGAIASPAELERAALEWHEARVPGTVASALLPDVESPGAFDADDWWYRITVPRPAATAGARFFLRFDGLATLATVWFNGEPVLESSNMFVGHRIDVTARVRDTNEIAIRFASLDVALAKKRPRGRWRTALVSQQNLRWFRTTLLGRIPGWTPPIVPVGPWAPVSLEWSDAVGVSGFQVRARADGTLRVAATVASIDGSVPTAARIRVGDAIHALVVEGDGRIHAEVAIANAPQWWPHTHGAPRLVECTLELKLEGNWVACDCARVGFRDVTLDTVNGRVQIVVNGVEVFCRGAAWMPLDVRAPWSDAASLRRALETARDAGVNMIRVGGTMVYESDEFYRLCDELGILVWQDFMFANLDYPVADPQFRDSVEAEARHQLARLARHPCIAVYCGGSEVAQQAAMMGLPPEQWSNELFDTTLPHWCSELHPGIAYFPSTPWGGALPFHVGTGITHYYGVGAYRRPLADVKTARVRFTPECLGFSNVPERATMDAILHGATPPPHHPRWKARVPRDGGAGWDFEDVRDHYLARLFDLDPVALRSQDMERYYALSRVVTGEVMLRTFAEWRARASGCGGALVWFMRDLWPGAGWGIIDSTGLPKAAYWYLRRAWASRCALLTDEGLDGHAIHVVNESASALSASVEIELYRDGRDRVAAGKADIELPARATALLQGDALLGRFTDSTHAYRFGPPGHDVVALRLLDRAGGAVISEDFCFPLGLNLPMQRTAPHCEAAWESDDKVVVTVSSECFLQSVRVDSPGWDCGENYFHVAPGCDRRLVFRARQSATPFRADFEPLNLREPVTLRARRR